MPAPYQLFLYSGRVVLERYWPCDSWFAGCFSTCAAKPGVFPLRSVGFD
jgi:hypothetical protein